MTPPDPREVALLVARAGGTPLYAYSRAALVASVARVRAASPTGARLYYSLKANPHPGVVRTLVELVDGVDVCSTRELETALDAGASPGSVMYTGPAKTPQELASALAAGVMVTVESLAQARSVVEVAARLQVTGAAVLRLSTRYPGRDGSPGEVTNQFGVPDQDLDAVVDVLAGSPVPVRGVQVFWGSQYGRAVTVLAARADALRRARALAQRHDLQLDVVSVGGGIASAWCAQDPDVDWDGLRDGRDALDPWPGGPAVVCEYGRSVVGPAGRLVTAVLDVKTVEGRPYVLVDAGMHHAMLTSRLVAGGSRGEPTVQVVGPPRGAPVPTWVTGPLCSQLDVLAAGVPLPPVQPGDLLVLPDVGAYGPTFSPGGFLSRDPVREVLH